MSRISKSLPKKTNKVENFMGGTSYTINPVNTLKIISASSIFGEASYYRDNVKDGKYKVDMYGRAYKNELLDSMCVLSDEYKAKSTTEIFIDAIDNALAYDFMSTLEWAVELRQKFLMRLNPQIIMVRAAMHPNRAKFTTKYPGKFAEFESKVMERADEPMIQLAAYMYFNDGKKNNMPTILKKNVKDKLESLTRYEVAKYKNHEIGMIDAVRLTHANNELIDELMRTGTVEISEDQATWENLKSAGKTWQEILNSNINFGHMAMLRNLRGVFTEINDIETCREYMGKLKNGVAKGKQFPFRYLQALKNIKGVNHEPIIIDGLEECMDIAVDNMPKLKGKTMCLSDNSGSAWGGFTSEYGKMTVAEIDNLSSVITAANSEEGYVGKFGDRLIKYPISKRKGILSQANDISKNKCNDVGGSTEGGIWEFFRDAIANNEWWDNIFIYSDQQAGHGGLYGTAKHQNEYKDYRMNYTYIDVFKLIQEYRRKVNPKVNVFSVQTAGYDNVLVPENAYRTSILYGWTGKELVYADAINKIWDSVE